MAELLQNLLRIQIPNLRLKNIQQRGCGPYYRMPDKGFLRYFVWRSKKDDAITKALEESAKIVKDYQDANEATDKYSTIKKLEEATKKWGSRHDSSPGKSTKSSKVRFSAGNRNKRHTYKRRSKT